jgi:DNA-binding winged helix-turn-helix (wHTH) protein/tetratricopeptide (TPR) repeat protein
MPDRPQADRRAYRSWTFGDFHLDEAERRLTRSGAAVALTPKGFDLLVVLLERKGALVRKHELMARLWPDTVVGEGTLARHVSSVRQALADGSSLIQTVQKSGYRIQERPGEVSAPAGDPAAHALYLRGRHFWGQRTEEGLRKALGYFDEALGRDASCAAAHAARADCLTLLAGYGEPPGALAEAGRAAERALALHAEPADAEVVLGLIAQKRDRDWAQAEARYLTALRLRPDHTTALQRRGELVALLGRFDEGLPLLRRACQLEPASLILGSDLAKALFCARRYDDAARECRAVLDMDPAFPRARAYLGLSLLMRGDHDAALSTLQAFGQRDASAYAQALVAYASAVAGRPQPAHELLWALAHLRRSEYVTPHALALAHLGLGQHERALDALERLVEEGHDVLGLGVTPLMDPLRDGRRFETLLVRAGLAAPEVRRRYRTSP